jgi:hypothetical protein
MPSKPKKAPGGKERRSPFPDRQALAASLRSAWGNGEPVVVLRRQRNVYERTFPSEVVTCRLPDGSRRRLLCKYSAGPGHRDGGRRGGGTYEAEVYRRALRGLPLPLPAFHGLCPGAGPVPSCLVLEFLDDSMTACKASEEGSMPAAARWAGLFHALMQERLRHDPLAFLVRYDAAYYRRWSRQALRAAKPVLSRHPWLRTVCRRYEERIPLLTGGPATVVHGEYTPHNVLWQRGRAVPIDWESAAVGTGEVDLATLVYGWDEATVRACGESYRQARWPRGAPPSFEETFAAARLFIAFRWLFDYSSLADEGRAPPDLCELYDFVEELEVS